MFPLSGKPTDGEAADGEDGDDTPEVSYENSDAVENGNEASFEPPEALKIGTIHLALLIFYAVAGGPVGMEPAVRSAGALFTLIGFLVMPLVWCVPEAYVTAELSTAFPEASGGVAWVEEAFGNLAGWLTGCFSWVAGATDNAIYPALFLDYFMQLIWGTNVSDLDFWMRAVVLTPTCILLCYVNYLGLQVVGDISIVICVISLAPFVLFCIIGAFKINVSLWLRTPQDDIVWDDMDDDPSGGFFPYASFDGIAWRTFLNNLFWNLNYFDEAASFAADVRDPGTVFPRATGMALVLIVLGYFLPLLVALGTSNPPRHAWVDGYLVVVVSNVVGKWLGAWVVFGIGISNLGLFEAELSSDSFKVMGMAERGFLPRFLAHRSRYGTPTNAIFLGASVILILSLSKMETLIEMLNFNYSISVLMEFAAFVKLRFSRPDLHRPFRIPLNTTGCIIVLIPCVLFMIVVMALATYRTYLVSLLTLVASLVLYAGRARWGMEEQNYDAVNPAPPEADPDATPLSPS